MLPPGGNHVGVNASDGEGEVDLVGINANEGGGDRGYVIDAVWANHAGNKGRAANLKAIGARVCH